MNIIDNGYYSIQYSDGTPTSYPKQVSRIFSSIIRNVHNVNVKNNLLINRPSYIVGNRVYDFPVFKDLFNVTTHDSRYFHDLFAFSDSTMLPGYISTELLTKDNYKDEDIIAHEILHSIEDALPLNLYQQLIDIFDKYAILNDRYDINAYAFANHHEMFAVFGTVFLGVNDRIDITGNIINNTLKEHLPELYTFLQDVFIESINVVYTSCSVHSHKKTYCTKWPIYVEKTNITINQVKVS
jgi:hypothetical protein